MIVLDASAAIALVLGTAQGAAIAARLGGEPELHAPHVIDLELAQVLRRYVRAGAVERGRAEMALGFFADLGVERHPHDALIRRIWALRDNLSAYDAAYVALAEALRAPLVTLDHGLDAIPGHTAEIEVL